MNIPDLLFSTQGRINRGKWWLGVVILVACSFVLGWLLWKVQGTSMFFTFSGRLMSFILSAAVLFAGFCLNAKRFQDRNKPKTLAYAALGVGLLKAVSDLLRMTGDPWAHNGSDTAFQVVLSVIGIWYLVELGCLRGTAGPNDYGADPLGGDPAPAQPGI